jgi:hypothetical protein
MILKSLKRICVRLIAGLTGLALTACATQPGPSGADAMRPALWRLADEDTTIYLFGTIHALPSGVEWRTPRIEEALAASQELVTEVVIGGDQSAAMAAMRRLGFAEGLPPLVERVPENQRAALREAVSATGLPEAMFDQMRTWAAAITLVQFAMQRAGINAELGVERGVTATFGERRRPVSGLETVEEQFGFFAGLPEEAQRSFLVAVLESPEEIRREFDAMLAAWTSGDTDAIARTFDDETMMSADLREILMTRRNARWAEWLEQRLGQPGTIFVAVGAGHLAGRSRGEG